MTNAKLFAKLRDLIEDASNTDKKHIKKIRKVLRKLKERQNALRASLDASDNPQEQRKVEQEIEVIKLQRGKGVEVYTQLKAARKMRNRKKSQHPAGTDGSGNKSDSSN